MRLRRAALSCALGLFLPSAWTGACAQEPPAPPADAAPAAGASEAPSAAASSASASVPVPAVAVWTPATAAGADATGVDPDAGDALGDAPPPGTGLAIYDAFLAGMADPGCDDAQERWRRHFAHAPQRLRDPDSDTLALFGYVVGALRDAGLPSELALIPFVESGYAPGARSKSGPAGLWQFVAATARHHGIRMEPGYDGRLSPAESTRAAVLYLKALHDRFDGNWRLVVMAYNAGEYRVLGSLRRGGDAAPDRVPGLPPVTYAYVEKLHALGCLLEQAGQQPGWRAGIDRPVPRLQARALDGAHALDAWAAANGYDAAALRRLNPALARQWPSRGAPWALVPAAPAVADAPGGATGGAAAGTGAGTQDPATDAHTHTVRRGDSAWSIARRHGLPLRRLLELNGLRADSVLHPGMTLRLE